MPRRSASLLRWTLTLLLTLVLALEIASAWWEVRWQHGRDEAPDHRHIAIGRGSVELVLQEGVNVPGTYVFSNPEGFTVRRFSAMFWPSTLHGDPMNWWSFEFDRRDWHPNGGWMVYCRLPLTYAILALALPTAWLWRGALRRRKKARIGCCRKCGYDLRGLERSKEEGQPRRPARCPECGTMEPQSAVRPRRPRRLRSPS